MEEIVLARWGSSVPGKKLGTKLAFVEVDYPSVQQVEVTFVKRQLRHPLHPSLKTIYYNRSRVISRRDVFYSWDHWPTASELREAKRHVPTCEE